MARGFNPGKGPLGRARFFKSPRHQPGNPSYAPGSYPAVVLGDNPLGYWRLGDNSTVAADSTPGQQNPGLLNGTITEGQPGVVNDGSAAMLFDGGTGAINLNNPALFQITGNMTLEAWVKTTDSDVTGFLAIVCKQSTYTMLKRNNHLALYNNGTGTAYESTQLINDGKWHHCVVVQQHNVASGSTFYVDGVAAGVGTWQYWDNSGRLALGASDNGGVGFQQYFPGTIAEVAVYNYMLTATQVLAHYNAVVTPIAGAATATSAIAGAAFPASACAGPVTNVSATSATLTMTSSALAGSITSTSGVNGALLGLVGISNFALTGTLTEAVAAQGSATASSRFVGTLQALSGLQVQGLSASIEAGSGPLNLAIAGQGSAAAASVLASTLQTGSGLQVAGLSASVEAGSGPLNLAVALGATSSATSGLDSSTLTLTVVGPSMLRTADVGPRFRVQVRIPLGVVPVIILVSSADSSTGFSATLSVPGTLNVAAAATAGSGFSASPTLAVAAQASASAQAIFNAVASTSETLAGSTLSTITDSGTLSATRALAAGASAGATLSANLQVVSALQVAGLSAASDGLSGPLVLAVAVGAGSVSASSLSSTLSLASSLTASSTSLDSFSASLGQAVQVASVAAVGSGLSANLQVATGLQVAGLSASVEAGSGPLNLAVALLAATTSVESSTVNLGVAVQMASVSVVGSGLTGNLQVLTGLQIAGTSLANSSSSAPLKLASVLATGLASATSFSATLGGVTTPLAASSWAVWGLGAGASLAVQVAAGAVANSAFTATLQVASGLQVAGAVLSTDSLSGPLSLSVALGAGSTSTSALSPILGVSTSIGASPGSITGLAANLQLLTGLQIPGVSTAVSSSSATLNLTVGLGVSSTSIAALSGLLSGVTTPLVASSGMLSTLAPSLGQAIQLAAGLTVRSIFSSTLQVLSGLQVQGLSASVEAGSGPLTLVVALGAPSNVVFSLSPTLGLSVKLVSPSTSVSSLSANLLAPMFFTAAPSSVSTVNGNLSLALALSAGSSATSSTTAPLGLLYGLQGLILIASATGLNPLYRDIVIYLGQPFSRWQVQRPVVRWQVSGVRTNP